jgi:Skp family chaperone for outer membrane proteins
MPTRRRSRSSVPRPAPRAAATPSVRTLERRLREATAQLESERQRHARQLEAVRRAADRKLAEMVREIVALRHHEARAEMLARLLAERDAAIPAREESTHAEAARPLGG